MHTHGPAALLEERDEIEGGVSARPSPNTPKPGEERVGLLGEGGYWWGGGSSNPGMVDVSIPPFARRQSSIRSIFCCQKSMMSRRWGRVWKPTCSSAANGRSDSIRTDIWK
jgi:hypothetical protein